MYGDMARVRSRASELRALAHELVEAGRSLVAQAEAMAWQSKSGEAFRMQLAGIAADLGASAARLDDAASALESHAAAVEQVKHSIADAQRWVSARVNDALSILRGIGDGAARTVEQTIAAAGSSSPVLGSKDWLELKSTFERRGWV